MIALIVGIVLVIISVVIGLLKNKPREVWAKYGVEAFQTNSDVLSFALTFAGWLAIGLGLVQIVA